MVYDLYSLTLSSQTLLVLSKALQIAFRTTGNEDFLEAKSWINEGIETADEYELPYVENDIDDYTYDLLKQAAHIAMADAKDDMERLQYRFALFELISEEEGEENDEEEDPEHDF